MIASKVLYINLLACFVLYTHAVDHPNYARKGADDKTYEKYLHVCEPARCYEEGFCFCLERFRGWSSNGAWCDSKDFSCRWPNNGGDCRCASCGRDWTQCGEYRCDDEVGYDIVPNKLPSQVKEDDEGRRQCKKYGSSGELEPDSLTWYVNCFLYKQNCSTQGTQCDTWGEHQVGCKRINPGTCAPCDAKLNPNKYWAAKGRCEQKDCGAAPPGSYVITPCNIQGKPAEFKTCEELMYVVNTGSQNISTQNRNTKLYYCPGGYNSTYYKKPTLSTVNADFSGYACNPGTYSTATEQCIKCPRGHCCKDGNIYTCPQNYFAPDEFSAACTRCALTCPDKGMLRQRCEAGSIQNAVCLMCPQCGIWPKTGLNCVENSDVLDKLPDQFCGNYTHG